MSWYADNPPDEPAAPGPPAPTPSPPTPGAPPPAYDHQLAGTAPGQQGTPYQGNAQFGIPRAENYARWEKRAGAFLIDGFLPWMVDYILILIVSVILPWQVAILVNLLCWVGALGFVIWNQIRQGNTGQTIGKGLVGTRLVRAADGQNVGPGLAVGRYFLHIIDGLPLFLGYLWPLWDEKRQTFADKLVDTVVIEA